jgi:hypothetical protein
MPLYLVHVRGVAADAAVIGATLATYGVAAAAAGMLSGLLEGASGACGWWSAPCCWRHPCRR